MMLTRSEEVVVGMACPENSEKIAWGKSQVVVDSKGLVKRQLVDLYGSACGKSAQLEFYC